MGKSFFNFIQPTIVRLSDDPEIPENLRNHYLVNLNVVGIQYFVDNYLLIEDGHGGYMYMLTNDFHKIRLSDTGLEGVIDVPRAYIVISEEFVKSQDDFSSWILSSIADNSFFVTGTKDFVAGKDFYINDVLFNYLKQEEREAVENIPLGRQLVLPDYLDGNFNITKYWQEIPAEMARYTNFEFFRLKNKIADLTYSEEELEDLKHTFFTILENDAKTSDEDSLKLYNQIYKAVIDYYYNGETDCALSGIALILNSRINVQNEGMPSCGCSGSSANSAELSYSTLTCYEAYKQAMAYWLKTMLGDVNFYKDWMWMTDAEGDYVANEGLIKELIELLENFLEADFDLSFSGKSIYNHTCGSDINAELNEGRRKVIENYITLLKWVLAGCIDNNTNKIKVIGEKFGELLPLLQF